MSFQDLESGRTIGPIIQDPTQTAASGIFQINTAVSSFHRLVHTLGTPKDTVNLRQKLHKTRLHIRELLKNTDNAIKKIRNTKLAKDFKAVKNEFQKAQRLAAERETRYNTMPHEHAATLLVDSKKHEVHSSSGSERYSEHAAPLLVDSKRREGEVPVLLLLDTIIEEREKGIQEIENHIIEVNEIFKDLAVVVQEQRIVIDDIDSNTENVQAATRQGRTQLAKTAAKREKTNSSLACLIFLIFWIVLLIGIFLLLAQPNHSGVQLLGIGH